MALYRRSEWQHWASAAPLQPPYWRYFRTSGYSNTAKRKPASPEMDEAPHIATNITKRPDPLRSVSAIDEALGYLPLP
jgi:hypothetical protein